MSYTHIRLLIRAEIHRDSIYYYHSLIFKLGSESQIMPQTVL